jgi:hypothetical protein
MPSRPDIRDLVTNVREAFGDADRETLLEVLTFVVKEYVVEGPPPMLVHQAETLSDMQGKTFAQLITALQTRFDHAELAMFVVDGEQVGVRIGGVVHPLLPGRTPPVQMIDTRPNSAPPPPGVRVVEATLAPRPAPAGQAPPPSRGVSLRGQPTGNAPAPAPAAPAPATAATPPAAAATPPAAAATPGAAPTAPEKPEGSGDDASARFSLLELD